MKFRTTAASMVLIPVSIDVRTQASCHRAAKTTDLQRTVQTRERGKRYRNEQNRPHWTIQRSRQDSAGSGLGSAVWNRPPVSPRRQQSTSGRSTPQGERACRAVAAYEFTVKLLARKNSPYPRIPHATRFPPRRLSIRSRTWTDRQRNSGTNHLGFSIVILTRILL